MQALKGHCHCGAVQFEVRSEGGPQGLRRCDCSLCSKKGAIMATAPLADFKVIGGADKISQYQWNTKVAKHYFCSICGIYTHHQRRSAPDEYGYNVACLEGINIKALGDIPMTDGSSMSLVDTE